MANFSFRRMSVILIGIVAAWLFFRFLLPIAMPFLLAGLLSIAAEPLVIVQEKRLHLPRVWASILGVLLALVLTILLVVALCAFLVRELSSLAIVLPDLENATLSGLNSLEYWLLDLAQKAPKGINSILSNGVEGIFSGGSTLLDQVASKLFSLATSVLKALPDSALGIGTWILASFMLSVRLPKIKQWLSSHLPKAWREQYLPYLQTLKKTVLGWLTAQAKLVCVTFSVLLAGFLLLRIDHPVLWAATVCLVDILPILGTGTVLIPWSLVCFLQGNHLQGIGLLAVYAIVSLLRSVLEPKLVGKQLGLDPLVTLFAIYAGYRLWGLVGMLIAPILAVVLTQIFLQAKKGTSFP